MIFSKGSSTRRFCLKPAVSINRTSCPPTTAGTSTASRVVPAMGATMVRSIPTQALTRDDLPAFGRPTTASRVLSSLMRSASGQAFPMLSIKSPNPRPCSAETCIPSPKPKRLNSLNFPLEYPGSILLMTRVTFCPAFLRRFATSVSKTCNPSFPSTTKSTR